MNKKKNKKPKHRTKANPQPKTPAILPVSTENKAAESVPPKGQSPQKEGQNMNEVRTTDRVIMWATVFIALATMVQGYELITGSRDTHKLAESTLAASRAWVVVQGTGFGFTKDKNFPTGRVVLADSGESPAFGVEGWRCVEVRIAEPPITNEELQKSPTAVCLPINGGVLGRGVPISMDAYVPANVPPDFSNETEGVGAHFYYWGIVTYDIYPKDVRHSMSFCLKNAGEQLSACKEGGYHAN